MALASASWYGQKDMWFARSTSTANEDEAQCKRGERTASAELIELGDRESSLRIY